MLESDLDLKRQVAELQNEVDGLTELVTILLRQSQGALKEAEDSFDMLNYNAQADQQQPDSVRPIIHEAMQLTPQPTPSPPGWLVERVKLEERQLACNSTVLFDRLKAIASDSVTWMNSQANGQFQLVDDDQPVKFEVTTMDGRSFVTFLNTGTAVSVNIRHPSHNETKFAVTPRWSSSDGCCKLLMKQTDAQTSHTNDTEEDISRLALEPVFFPD